MRPSVSNGLRESRVSRPCPRTAPGPRQPRQRPDSSGLVGSQKTPRTLSLFVRCTASPASCFSNLSDPNCSFQVSRRQCARRFRCGGHCLSLQLHPALMLVPRSWQTRARQRLANDSIMETTRYSTPPPPCLLRTRPPSSLRSVALATTITPPRRASPSPCGAPPGVSCACFR